MAFEQTWRWFGPNDPISLKEIRQTGATGIVTALHHIPVGEIWAIDDIMKRKLVIETEGLSWSVVESLPVHENIKKRSGNYRQSIKNYKTSIRNLSQCGIDIICYNFMPILDWARTDLSVPFSDGSNTSRFESVAYNAFDLYILKRRNAENDYSEDQITSAKEYFKHLNEAQVDKLLRVALLGLPGSGETFSLEELRLKIEEYSEIGKEELHQNLSSFLCDIIPVAEENGILMAIHPDDPPRSLLGLPRVVSNKFDLESIVKAVDSISNGITFCTGSLGAGYDNDCVALAQQFAYRTSFIHLRNVKRNREGDFLEENHLDGDVDMHGVMRALLIEQKYRVDNGRNDIRMPFRPDHGHLMLGDLSEQKYYPGYSLYGRMRGLAELRGLELGIRRELNI